MKTIERNNIIWKPYQGALVPDVAPHVNIELTEDDKAYLLKESGAYFLRYTNDWDCKKETDFWYVIKDSFNGFEGLSSNTRNQVRKALKNCIIKRISKIEMQQGAYEVYKEAFRLYDTFIVPATKEEFLSNIDDEKNEYWGGYVDDKLVIYGQNSVTNNHCEYNVVKIHPDYLKLYPSYALFYEMNKHYLEVRKLKYVCDGARSISHQTNIQDFLISKFKFRKAYCRLNVVYRKDIGILVKLLFPFKSILEKIKIKPIEKIVVLLRHEKIRRNCAK